MLDKIQQVLKEGNHEHKPQGRHIETIRKQAEAALKALAKALPEAVPILGTKLRYSEYLYKELKSMGK